MQATSTLLLLRLSSAHCRGHSTLSRAISSVRAASEHLTGYSDVLAVQRRVRDEKEELRLCRNELQAATSRYKELQDEIKSFYIEKSHMQYQEQKRDLSLLKAVHDKEESLLREEQELLLRVEASRVRERDCFEGLSDVIQESHDRERAQNARMKYFSQIGSLLGALLGFLGSNLFLRREVRRHNVKQSEELAEMKEILQNYGTTRGAANSARGDVIAAADVEMKIQTLHSELQKQTSALGDLQTLMKDSYRPSPVPDAERTVGLPQTLDKESGGGNRDLAIVGLMHAIMWVLCFTY